MYFMPSKTKMKPEVRAVDEAAPSKIESLASVHITEGISSLWHYHVSNFDKARQMPSVRSVCGAKVMLTAMPLKDWAVPFGEHFPKRPTFCVDCSHKLAEMGFQNAIRHLATLGDKPDPKSIFPRNGAGSLMQVSHDPKQSRKEARP